MADYTRSRNPFSRVVAVPKPRNQTPDDSALATARGADLHTTEHFSGVSSNEDFNAFELTVGDDSPADRELGTMYAVRVPDSVGGEYVEIGNYLPIKTSLKQLVVQVKHVGITTASLFVGVPIFIGSVGVFDALVQTYVRPITIPNHFPHPVIDYDTTGLSGKVRFVDAFKGRIVFELYASLEVNTGPGVRVDWRVEKSSDQGSTWQDFATFAKTSYSSIDTRTKIHYKTPIEQHFKGTWYRFMLMRSAGPAGAMIITMEDSWLQATMDIEEI